MTEQAGSAKLPGETCTIRRANLADLAGLVLLEQTCFAMPWSEQSLRQELADNPAARCLVAEAPDGFLAGYVAYWSVLDEGQVTNLAVHPAWRRRGIGRRLLLAMISLAAAEHLSGLVLEVRAGNQAARGLYESVGFQPIGQRKEYYANNREDAIIMFKNINGLS
ncbi:MAG TPA: ribosomal-protein-alanine N-acetyltransferase [Clostridiales bacterium]|nr:ribosomal-protein-alanine N-acetyltransferase [Clostridiales bacterium]